MLSSGGPLYNQPSEWNINHTLIPRQANRAVETDSAQETGWTADEEHKQGRLINRH